MTSPTNQTDVRARRVVPPRAMIYTYEVINSTYPQVPVGTHLVDRRRDLSYTWDILDRKTGEHMWFTGKRGHRACNVCYSVGKVREHGHEGPHDEVAS